MQQQHSVLLLAVGFCLSDHQITRDHPITRFPAVKGFGLPISVISGMLLLSDVPVFRLPDAPIRLPVLSG